MRWSVEAPGGISAATPALLCGSSTSLEGERHEHDDHAGERGQRRQKLEEVW